MTLGSRRRTRGSTLILVVGVLGLMVLLVAAFAAIVTIEARAAANQRDSEQARLIAFAGLERAKYEVRRSLTTQGYPAIWLQSDAWDYKTNAFYASSAPSSLVKTTSPSLGVGYPSGQSPPAAQAALFGSTLPYPSGFMGSTYFRSMDATHPFMGDYYVLRITDCNSQIYVNDQHPHIKQMLDNLMDAAGNVLGNTTTFNAGKNLGATLTSASNMPPGGYRRMAEIRGVLLRAYPTVDGNGVIEGDKIFDGISPYITTRAWLDAKVIQAGNQQTGASGSFVPPTLTSQPRAPINVNLAPGPVLYAVLCGISWNNSGSPADAITPGEANALVSSILAYRQNPAMTIGNTPVAAYTKMTGTPATRRYGFGSWAEFQAFLTSDQNQSASVKSNQNKRDAILANCNPNTDLNKLVPDYSVYHAIDKTDLFGATTELSFSPGGLFSIDSLGVILGADGVSVVAQAQAHTVIRAFDRIVDTTQADFETGRLDTGGATALRDMTTFPEYRNNKNAANVTGAVAEQGGLLAASWDGQLCFNAIAAVTPSDNYTIAGYIDNTLNADNMGSAVGPAGGVRTAGTNPKPTSVCGNTGAATPWLTGSDLVPLGVLVGRQGRHLAYPKSATMGSGLRTTTYNPQYLNEHVRMNFQNDFNYNTVTNTYTQHYVTSDHSVLWNNYWVDNGGVVTDSGNGVAPLPAGETGVIDDPIDGTISSWTFSRIEQQGFAFWFKPPRGKGTQVLLDWHSGPAKSTGADFTIQGSTTALPATWGAQTWIHIWLTANGADKYDVHAKIHVDKKTGDDSGMTAAFDKEWVTTNAVTHGTWHHCHFNVNIGGGNPAQFFFDGVCPGSPKWPNTTITVPGAAWPKEFDTNERLTAEAVTIMAVYFQATVAAEMAHINQVLQEQIAAKDAESNRTNQTFSAAGMNGGEAVDAQAVLTHDVGNLVQASGSVVPFSLPSPTYTPTHLIPVRIPLGSGNTYHGCKDPACSSMAAGAGDFQGILDNIVYDNDRAVQPVQDGQPFDDQGYLARYDNYRPSTSSGGSSSDTLVYKKHVAVLEWDKPVRILTESMTAWKSVAGSGNVDLDVGKVDVRLGWIPVPSSGSGVTTPDMSATYTGTENQGWTAKLNQTAYCSLLNAYLVPDRTSQVGLGGFLTKAAGSEWYLYAIELSPTADDQGGPRMTPVIDDITITYMPWDCVTVLEEELLD